MVRATYDHDAPLEGRDMLLELRFLVFRTYAGCRVGEVVDEVRTVDGREVQVWGWPYRTLEGHVEQGEMSLGGVEVASTPARSSSASTPTRAWSPTATRSRGSASGWSASASATATSSEACRRIKRLVEEGAARRAPARVTRSAPSGDRLGRRALVPGRASR